MAVLEKRRPGDAKVLSRLMDRVADLASQLESEPSLRTREELGGIARDGATLVSHLCSLDGLGGDLDLPFRATLSRTLLIAKVQFLRGFVKSVCALPQEEEPIHTLNLELREELAQSIYTQLAEELLLALLRKPDVSDENKARASALLIAIWDDYNLEIDDFCPLLESAWHARNQITSKLGSLLGTSEYFTLVSKDCAPQFLDFFVRDEVSPGETQAFEEFLFNMTWEELSKLREAMKAQGVGACSEDFASGVLHRPIEHEINSDEIEPLAIYRSYYRRQLAADFRILAGSPGPRRTAEAYLMIYLLETQAQ